MVVLQDLSSRGQRRAANTAIVWEDGCKTSLTRHNKIDEDAPAALICLSIPPVIAPHSPRIRGKNNVTQGWVYAPKRDQKDTYGCQ